MVAHGLSDWDRAVAQLAVDDAVIQMEQTGIRLDTEFCSRTDKAAESDELDTLDRLTSWSLDSGLNWASGPQLKAFFDGRGLPRSPIWKRGRVKKDEFKVDSVALEWLASHVKSAEDRAGIRLLLRLRKIRSSRKYLQKLPTFVNPATGLSHPVFGPAGDSDDRVGALSGRLACKNPEFQQLPRDPRKDWYRIRFAVVAGEGESLLAVDYAALEVVVLAHLLAVLFGDTSLIDALAPDAPDFHSVNARRVFGEYLGWTIPPGFPGVASPVAALSLSDFKGGHPYASWLRDLVKAVWYGLQYGKGDYGFGWTLLDPAGNPIGEDRARSIRLALLEIVPGISRWHDWVADYIGRAGGIPSLDGRWCELESLVQGDDWERRRAERRADNFPMQAGAADIVNRAMVAVCLDPRLKALGWKLILQVHDELVLRGPTRHGEEAKRLVEEKMTGAYPGLRGSLRVKGRLAQTWEECKS